MIFQDFNLSTQDNEQLVENSLDDDEPERIPRTWPATITLDSVEVDNDGNPLPAADDEFDVFGIDDEPDLFESPITVAMACNENRISESKVEILDCYEGPRGEDILVFICPVCKQKHESVRLG